MRLPVEPPFDLRATVRLLQRRPRNPLDRWVDGEWLRLFDFPDGPIAVAVRQRAPEALELRWPAGRPPAAAVRRVVAIVRRTLGLDVDLAPFHRAVARFPALASLGPVLAGARPPRFTSLFEAVIGVVPFQQVSLDAGMTIFGRIVERYGRALDLAPREGALRLYAAPRAEAIVRASIEALRGLGMSAAKARALRSAAAAILDGALREEEIERLPTPAARARLIALPGIGPWSADLILLRGFGHLDVFPPGDVGVARGLAALLGGAQPPQRLAEAFAPQQGMLYYTSLLAQLRARGLL